MAYKYDIFISYRRNEEALRWIRKHFIPILQLRVEFELGRKPILYIDEQLEAGTSWPVKLGEEIGQSRILIPLWSKNYLNSRWCTCEISHMVERENSVGYPRRTGGYGLIIPVVIHDGESMPPRISGIQKIEIQKCFNVRMSADSSKAEELDDRLNDAAAGIATAIDKAPAWKKDWKIQAMNKFYKEFYKGQTSKQARLPKYTSR